MRLASSPLIPNQAFRAGERAYGVQFHLEVTAEMAVEWAEVPAYRSSLAETLGEEEGAAFLADAIPAYRESLAATLGERAGAAFIADVERRAGRAPPARPAAVRELARSRREAA